MKDFNVIGVVCEHIREEAGGKTTLIGIYRDIANVPKVPGGFSQLAFYVHMHFKRGYPLKELKLILRPIGEEPIELGTFDAGSLCKAEDVDKDDPAPYVGVVMQAVMGAVPIKAEGRMIVAVRINGEEHVATSLRIRVRPPKTATGPSNALPQSSEQSQSVS